MTSPKKREPSAEVLAMSHALNAKIQAGSALACRFSS